MAEAREEWTDEVRQGFEETVPWLKALPLGGHGEAGDAAMAARAIGLAAALRPALLAADAAGGVVEGTDLLAAAGPIAALAAAECDPRLSGSLGDYCEAIRRRYLTRRDPLDPYALTAGQSLETWEKELKSLTEEAAAWFSRLDSRGGRFPPATHVLKVMIREGGLIDRLIKPVLQNRLDQLEETQRSANRLSDGYIRRCVNEIDATMRDAAKSKEIQGDPYNIQLRGSVTQAKEYVARWYELHRRKPKGSRASVNERDAELVKELRGLSQEAIDRLDGLAEGQAVPVQAGLAACRRVVEGLRRLIDQGRPPAGRGPVPGTC